MKFANIRQGEHLFLAVLLLIMFILDWQIPFGPAVGICYLIPLILAGRASSPRIVRLVAAASSALIVAGYFLSPPGTVPPAMVLFSRLGGIAVIWAAATLLTGGTQEDQRLWTTFEAIPSGLLVADGMGHLASGKPFPRRSRPSSRPTRPNTRRRPSASRRTRKPCSPSTASRPSIGIIS